MSNLLSQQSDYQSNMMDSRKDSSMLKKKNNSLNQKLLKI